MKKTRLVIVNLILSIAFYSCHSNKQAADDNATIDSAGCIKIKINPDDALKNGKLVRSSSLFDSVQYIPLETTPKSTFVNIDQLEVTPDYLIVLDQDTKSILIFFKNGKFYKRINGVKAVFFTVDIKNKLIVFPDYDKRSGSLMNYDFDGNYVNTTDLGGEFRGLTFLTSGQLVGYRSYFNEGVYTEERKSYSAALSNIIYYKDYQSGTKFLPYDTLVINYKEVLNPQKNFYNSPGRSLFIKPYDYFVYELKDSKLNKAFEIILPDYAHVPADFTSNGKYKNERFTFLKRRADMVSVVSDFYHVNDNVFMKLSSSKPGGVGSYMYNIKTGAFIPFSHIISDTSTYYLPLGMYALAAEGDFVYTYVPSTMLVSSLWDTKGLKGRQLPPAVKAFSEHSTNLSNPVIIKLYPKKTKN